MEKLLKLLVLFSVVGIPSYLVSYDQASDAISFEGQKILDSKANIDARIVNESMYRQPFNSEGIEDLVDTSLSGTDFSKGFKVDSNHNLLADIAIKDLFDYFLSTLGEYDLEQVIASIQNNIRSELSEPARSQALNLLKRYIDYKIGIEELQESFLAIKDDRAMVDVLISQQTEIKAYRQTYFNMEEYAAFFEHEDIQNEFLIEQLRISRDPSLSASQKQEMLSQAEKMLPEDMLETRKRSQEHALLGEQIREMKSKHASDEEIFSVREEVLGSDAAMALADLDQQRELWNQRLALFSDERNRVMASSLSEGDKKRSVSELLAFHFTDIEQKRVNALLSDGRL